MFKYNGSSWNDFIRTDPEDWLEAIWGTSGNSIYIGGSGGALYYFNGETLKKFNTTVNGYTYKSRWYSIAGTADESEVYVTGSGGIVLKLNKEKMAVNVIPTGDTASLISIKKIKNTQKYLIVGSSGFMKWLENDIFTNVSQSQMTKSSLYGIE